MSAGVYLDHNVEYAIAEGLQRRGVSVMIAREDGRSRAPDGELLARATVLECILFTYDKDFIEIANAWLAVGRPFMTVAFVPQQHLSIGEVIDNLEYLVKAHNIEELRNGFYYLPLR